MRSVEVNREVFPMVSPVTGSATGSYYQCDLVEPCMYAYGAGRDRQSHLPSPKAVAAQQAMPLSGPVVAIMPPALAHSADAPPPGVGGGAGRPGDAQGGPGAGNLGLGGHGGIIQLRPHRHTADSRTVQFLMHGIFDTCSY